MSQFAHPALSDITLTGVLFAVGDPVRLYIVRKLYKYPDGANCGEASPPTGVARSTLSNHYRVLRETGLIRTMKKGVEHISVLRFAELEEKFPGLLPTILEIAESSTHTD
jgi:DNA-binding transcriptional ArsR family regulator